MGIDDVLRSKREEILRIARKHGVTWVRVFGSFARGEEDESSDLDLLIEVKGPTPPWFPDGLVADLGVLLGRRVSVVEPEALREGTRSRLLQGTIPL